MEPLYEYAATEIERLRGIESECAAYRARLATAENQITTQFKEIERLRKEIETER